MLLSSFIDQMLLVDASELYLIPGTHVQMKVHGELHQVQGQPWDQVQSQALLNVLMNEQQHAEFLNYHDQHFTVTLPSYGRFRCHVFWQRQQPAVMIKRLKLTLPEFEALNLPEAVCSLMSHRSGLVLFGGGPQSGKSTSLAAALMYRNRSKHDHVLTLEDPIEYELDNYKGIMIQREIGTDLMSFELGIKHAFCQAPNVLVLGNICDLSTLKGAIAFALTGHLVIACCSGINVDSVLHRLINLYPVVDQSRMLFEFSQVFKGIVAQQLIPTGKDNKRLAIFDVLLATKKVKVAIQNNNIDELHELMKSSKSVGMCTFDNCLLNLCQQKVISLEQALAFAESPQDIKLQLKIKGKHSQPATTTRTIFEIE